MKTNEATTTPACSHRPNTQLVGPFRLGQPLANTSAADDLVMGAGGNITWRMSTPITASNVSVVIREDQRKGECCCTPSLCCRKEAGVRLGGVAVRTLVCPQTATRAATPRHVALLYLDARAQARWSLNPPQTPRSIAVFPVCTLAHCAATPATRTHTHSLSLVPRPFCRRFAAVSPRRAPNTGQLIGEYTLWCGGALCDMATLGPGGTIPAYHSVPDRSQAGVGHKRILLMAPASANAALPLGEEAWGCSEATCVGAGVCLVV